MSIRLGIVFRPQFAPELLREVAQAADESGVDELWLWEDCFDHGGVASASAALAWTERLAVGVGVLPAPLRNVALAAMETATLARMFPGRVHIGVGHGVLDWMGQIGARVASPMTLLREYVQALQALLAGERVTIDGRYVRLEDVGLGWAPDPKPPLHVGAIKPKTVALAGEFADGLVVTGGTPPDELARARAGFDAAWAAGRPGRGRVTVYLMAIVGPDAEQRYADEVTKWGLREERSDLEFGAWGDAPAIAAAVRRWADAGADTVVLQPAADDDPVAYARFAGEQIRPLLG
jgi:alkanesulfonate monooxygenase SsuD/methylene tetrahydromethanopterin reductase-like flavin-dependent oxidoreductase (luciferase family)